MSSIVLPEKIEKIFLDLDDVLVDFIGEVMLMYGHKPVSSTEAMRKFWKWLDNKEQQPGLQERLEQKGWEWWAKLEKLPWADELIEAAERACDDVIILTSPGRGKNASEAAKGKMVWSLENFNDNRLILARYKYMCSSPGAVLIDDWQKFLEPWSKRGGTAVHLHREWHDKGQGHDAYDIIESLRKYARRHRRY